MLDKNFFHFIILFFENNNMQYQLFSSFRS